MTNFGTGTCTVVEVQLIPYDVTQNPNIKADNDWSPYNFQNIVNNFDQIKETIVLMVKKNDDENSLTVPEIILDTHITRSWFIAVDCLAVGLYDPSVLMASISVESVLNHDMRLESERQKTKYKWLDLDAKNLELAYKSGLPTNLLLNTNETFHSPVIEFAYRRNKVAHGDIDGYSQFYPAMIDENEYETVILDYGEKRPSKEHAIDQINKSKQFIIEWAKTNPKLRLH